MDKKYKALLFDLDDTILDFKASEAFALESLYSSFLSKWCERERFISTFKEINKKLWNEVNTKGLSPSHLKVVRFQHLSSALELDLDVEALRMHYEEKLGENIFWLKGAEESLVALKKVFKIGVITNGLTSVQRKKYELMQGCRLFECFLISEEIGLSKPHPQIFDMALNHLGVSRAETLMIGDSIESDAHGALNSGLDFCLVVNDVNRERAFPSHYRVQSLDELCSHLLSLT